MSEPVEALELIASVGEVRARAAEWIARKSSEDWTEARQAELDEWLAGSVANKVAFLRMSSAWEQTSRLKVVRAAQPSRPHSISSPRFRSASRRLAAVLLLVAAVGAGAASFLAGSGDQNFATSLGGRQTVTLDDGSIIELNTDTAVRVRITASQRRLWLNHGEAYLKVAHDAKRPFVVLAGDRRITDLGTKFTVRRNNERVKVALIEGSVSFEMPGMGSRGPIVLEPGHELLATDNKIVVTPTSDSALAKELSWRRGQLVFDNATLADVAAEFNRYNRTKLVIADATAARRTMGASFATDDVGLFARMARNVLRLRVEERGNQIIISSRSNGQ